MKRRSKWSSMRRLDPSQTLLTLTCADLAILAKRSEEKEETPFSKRIDDASSYIASTKTNSSTALRTHTFSFPIISQVYQATSETKRREQRRLQRRELVGHD